MTVKVLALPKSFGIGSFQITFYSIFILTGALLALLIGMIRVKKLHYDPKRLENLFLAAFPAGLVGARLWYIICQWHEFAPAFKDSFWVGLGNLFGITENGIQISGLAIEGGVFLGVIVGILFAMKYRKEMKPLDVADVCVPGILLAQAVGRWGNFFNQEVYGKAVDPSGWSWMGSWFVDQMTIDGAFRNPLFLIEGLLNIAGFLVLTFGLGNKFVRKYLTPGTVTLGYFVWYGVVRAILEPMRDPAFIMADYISVVTSIVFVVFGVVGLALLYAYRYYFKKKFNLHLFDKRIAPNVYVDFATDQYVDQNNNVIENIDEILKPKEAEETVPEKSKPEKKIKVKKEKGTEDDR